jgi:hypothetical protein
VGGKATPGFKSSQRGLAFVAVVDRGLGADTIYRKGGCLSHATLAIGTPLARVSTVWRKDNHMRGPYNIIGVLVVIILLVILLRLLGIL